MSDPYCLAMVICDHIHADPATGKFTLLGTFSSLVAEKYPARLDASIYISLTDVDGPRKQVLRLVHSDHLVDQAIEPVFELEVDFPSCDNPVAVLESVIQINVDLPKPGLYHFELFIGDDLVMSRRLLAVTMEQMEEGRKDA